MAEIAIVGAGAAGLFAAGTALEQGHSVTIIEHMKKPGQKLAITGKGRCNITNDCNEEEFLTNVRSNPRFLYSAIHRLSPASVMDIFENKLGVALKVERGRRVFPKSDRAEEVIAALLRYTEKANYCNQQARELVISADKRTTGVKLTNGQIIQADAVILATGGMSYPTTGSTGIGYAMAKQAGHTIVEPLPSLVSMVERGNVAKRMTGLSLKNVELSLWQEKRLVFREQGEMLFTHFGISGPLVLSASAFLKDLKKYNYTVTIDMKPALSEEQLDARLLRDFAEMSNRNISGSLDKLLPASMRPIMLELWGVNPADKVNQITRAERLRLVALVKNFPVAIADRGDLNHAVITAGGISVKEVDPRTMQSRFSAGLYFAGEILDVDAYTGGYNLQIAWCTAFAAATSIE